MTTLAPQTELLKNPGFVPPDLNPAEHRIIGEHHFGVRAVFDVSGTSTWVHIAGAARRALPHLFDVDVHDFGRGEDLRDRDLAERRLAGVPS